jgi:hypothetical protein
MRKKLKPKFFPNSSDTPNLKASSGNSTCMVSRRWKIKTLTDSDIQIWSKEILSFLLNLKENSKIPHTNSIQTIKSPTKTAKTYPNNKWTLRKPHRNNHSKSGKQKKIKLKAP